MLDLKLLNKVNEVETQTGQSLPSLLSKVPLGNVLTAFKELQIADLVEMVNSVPISKLTHGLTIITPDEIIFKTDRSIYISIEFTKNKITSIRTIAFFTPTFPHLQMLPYGKNRANFKIDKFPLAYEDKTPLSFERIKEVESIVRHLATLLMQVEFEMLG